MPAPKPITLTSVATNAYEGAQDPQPFVAVGGVPMAAATTSAAGAVKRTPAITDVTAPDATDEASAVVLANANKAKINALLAALRTAGIVTP